MSPKRPIFSFLRSRGARFQCPFCGKSDWEGWDERISLEHVSGSFAVDRRAQAYPLTCHNCGFIRLQAAHVLDDPRAVGRNEESAEPSHMRALPPDGESSQGESDVVE